MNLQKVWQILNNRKTSIGAGLLFTAMVLQKLSEIWLDEISPQWLEHLIETLHWLGGLFAGIGLTHKGVKASTEKIV